MPNQPSQLSIAAAGSESTATPRTPAEFVSSSQPSAAKVERIACLVAGGVLAGLGLRRRGPLGALAGVLGAAFLWRGVRGHFGIAERMGALPEESDRLPWQRQIFVRETIAIMRPREEVYAFWRNFENLPRFMRHLEAVQVETERLSHWEAKGPIGKNARWDAEVTVDQPNEIVAWRSLGGSQVENAGEVHFADAPGGRGTIVTVQLTYRPPAGVLGAAFARLFGEEPHGQIADDLRRLRSILEVGEAPTTQGQPSDRVRKAKGWIGMRFLGPGMSDDPVPDEEANSR